MNRHTLYETPFNQRYASPEMSHLFSRGYRTVLWRKLWIALAKTQKEFGLPITQKQIDSLEAQVTNIDWDRIDQLEKKTRHDVMAHIHAFGEVAKEAKGIIHLGMTSCFVTDNADLIIMKEALLLLEKKWKEIIAALAFFAQKHAGLVCVGYTHFQAAQPTTVGKRACLWLHDLLIDLSELQRRIKQIRFLGVKGATGSQSALLSLLNHREDLVDQIDQKIAAMFGFSSVFSITGQTYTRKIDLLIVDTLGSFAASIHKCGTDMRLLSHLHELKEPFHQNQVGSSAMPHKRNPVLAERMCGLSRFLISLRENPSYTLATQWLERSLDDSSNRRLVLPEAFLAADALAHLLFSIIDGVEVNRDRIEENLAQEKPFLVLEEILTSSVKKGKDREYIHAQMQKIAQFLREGISFEECLKEIVQDTALGLTEKECREIFEKFNAAGCSERQVEFFLKEEVFPVIEERSSYEMKKVEF